MFYVEHSPPARPCPSPEELLLGCILDKPTLVREIPVRSGLWSDERCRIIYNLILAAADRGFPIEDPVGVQAAIMRKFPGLTPWAAELVNAIPGPESWPYWFAATREKAAQRYQKALGAAWASCTSSTDRKRILEQMTALDRALDEGFEPRNPKLLAPPSRTSAAVGLAMAHIDAHLSGDQSHRGIPTGFPRIDALTGGLKKKEFWVIAGRPGEGKTTFGVQLLSTISPKIGCVFFSLEMASDELLTAVAHCESGISRTALSGGQCTDEEMASLSRTFCGFAQRNLEMFDRESTFEAINAALRRLIRERGNVFRVVFVDYLQRIVSPSAKDRWNAIAATSNALKNLAMELDITIVAMAQLGREPEKEGRSARLADLRGSADIEADADVVGILQRDKESRVKLCLAKVRRGRCGEVPLNVNFDTCQIVQRSIVD